MGKSKKDIRKKRARKRMRPTLVSHSDTVLSNEPEVPISHEEKGREGGEGGEGGKNEGGGGGPRGKRNMFMNGA